MSLLGGLLLGGSNAAINYGTQRVKDQEKADENQHEIDKENRILEAHRADAATLRAQQLQDYKTGRTDKAADDTNTRKLQIEDHVLSRIEHKADHDIGITDTIASERRATAAAKQLESDTFDNSVDPYRVNKARSVKVGDQTALDKYSDSRFPTLLGQKEQINKITDHYSPKEQGLKEQILQKSLDATNIPDSIKEDNKGIRDEIAQNKASRTQLELSGNATPESRAILDKADNLLFARLHENITPYLPKIDDDPRGINDSTPSQKRTYKNEDGSIETRTGGTLSWRNNNPGNLKDGDFSQGSGSIGVDQNGFAIFPDEETGANAAHDLIFTSNNYKDLNLTKAISRYAPRSDKNDTDKYAKILLDSVGGNNKKMSEYNPDERQAIMSAIFKHEGYKKGTSNITGSPDVVAETGMIGSNRERQVTPPANDQGKGLLVTPKYNQMAKNYIDFPSPKDNKYADLEQIKNDKSLSMADKIDQISAIIEIASRNRT